MFLQIQKLIRTGASDPPEGVELELIRVDLIQRIRPGKLPGWDDPCTELVLEGDEIVYCQGEIADIARALDSL